MNTDALTGEFETVLERARGALTQEIATARATLQKLKSETADASKALNDIHNEHKRVEAELSSVMKDLQRASTKLGLDHEIKEARKELKTLQDEIAKATTTLAGLVTERRAAEGQAAALRMEASQWAAARSDAEAAIRRLRERFA